VTFRLLYVFVVIEHHSRRLIHCNVVKVLKLRPHSPMANAVCERVIGTIRRECLDWLIPLSEHHLGRILNRTPVRATSILGGLHHESSVMPAGV
jgi:hypothetical protein